MDVPQSKGHLVCNTEVGQSLVWAVRLWITLALINVYILQEIYSWYLMRIGLVDGLLDRYEENLPFQWNGFLFGSDPGCLDCLLQWHFGCIEG